MQNTQSSRCSSPSTAREVAFLAVLLTASTSCGAAEGDPLDEVGEVSSEVLNGIDDFSEFRSDDRRVSSTVRFRNMTLPANCPGTVGLGSGVLLRNDVVLTARHVVEDYGTSCTNPSVVAPLDQLYVYAANSTSEPASCPANACSRPEEIYFAPNGADVALVFLSNPVRGFKNSTLTHSVPMYVHNPANYLDEGVWISGYGINTCSGGGSGHGTLRFGRPTMSDRSSTIVTFIPDPVTGMLAGSGDSGGPGWSDYNNETFPHSAFSVASKGVCGAFIENVAPEAYRDWARTLMANKLTTYTWEFGDGMNLDSPYWTRDNPDNASETPVWYKGNGRLHEDSNSLGQKADDTPNYPDGPLLIHAGDIHESVWLDMKVQTSDNDAAGFVFRYVDSTHYYLATINQQSGIANIYKRSGSTFTSLASASKSVNWSAPGGATLQVRVQDYTFKFYVNGSLAVTASDTKYPVGSVGIFKYALSDATFDSFKVTPKTPATTAHWPL